MGARPQFANGGGFDHFFANRGQNRRHLQNAAFAKPFRLRPSSRKSPRSRLIPRNDNRERPSKPKRAFRKAGTVESESTSTPLTPSTPPSGGLRPFLSARAWVLADGRRATAQRRQENHRSGPRWTEGATRGRLRMHLAIPDMRCCKKMTCLRPHGAD